MDRRLIPFIIAYNLNIHWHRAVLILENRAKWENTKHGLEVIQEEARLNKLADEYWAKATLPGNLKRDSFDECSGITTNKG